jgi:hypothetical protein
MSKAFREILTKYGIAQKTLCITLDNASNNDTFIQDLINCKFIKSKESQARCLPHVLNLAAQVCLVEFEDKIQPLRTAIKAIRYSPLKLERLALFCSQEEPPIKSVKPILDVKTRWNSTFDMLERALVLTAPLTRLFAEIAMEPIRSGGELFPVFSTTNWECYISIRDLLNPFKIVTVATSGDLYTTYSTVLPLYNVLIEHLTATEILYDGHIFDIQQRAAGHTSLPTLEFCEDLRNAAQAANEKLMGYYVFKMLW